MVAQKKVAAEKKPHYCRCPKCTYVWKARVAHPKSCPECKTRLGWYTPKRSR